MIMIQRLVAVLKARLYLVVPHRVLVQVQRLLFRRKKGNTRLYLYPEIIQHPVFLVNYRGQYVDASSLPPKGKPLLAHNNVIHFSSPLKSHRAEMPTAGLVDRRIGAPIKLLSDILLRDYITHPSLIEHNFKRQQLDKLGVNRLKVYGYPKVEEPFTLSAYTTLQLGADPEHYFDRAAQHFTEYALLPKLAAFDWQAARDARGLLPVTPHEDMQKIHSDFRLTFTAYSYGGEFLHMVRNCLMAYMQPFFSPEQQALLLRHVTVISAGANNPVLASPIYFNTIRLVNRNDEHVLKKLDLRAYYPLRRGSRDVALSANETLIWLDVPYRFDHLSYEGNTQVRKQLTNYQFHLERAYFNPFYFPDTAHAALIRSIRGI